jgi:hypothetical protein
MSSGCCSCFGAPPPPGTTSVTTVTLASVVARGLLLWLLLQLWQLPSGAGAGGLGG